MESGSSTSVIGLKLTVNACARNAVLVGLPEQTRVFSQDERSARLLEHISAGGRTVSGTGVGAPGGLRGYGRSLTSVR